MHMFRNTPGVSQLPAELITLILQELSYTDLLRCERVSKHYRKLIRGTSVLQYKIELAQSGMDDIPSNGLSTATKREILARHTNATQTWPDHMVTKQTIPLLEGPLWELCGGVLAQSDGRRDLDFWQLPSAIRGITPRKWGVDVEFDIADFTVDPSQDLLVAMEVQSPTCFAHLLSLNTGKPHDGAAEKSLSFPLPPFDTPNRSYHIRVCGDFVGIIIRVYGLMSDEPHTVLGISNWKTGETKLLTSFWGIRSFAFLDDRHAVILRGVPRVPSPDVPGQESASNVVVSVIDFRKAVPPNAMSEAPLCPCVTLNLPTVADRWEVWHAEVVCDPSPACPPPNGPVASGGSSVPPFRVTHTDRIVVIRINGVDTLFEQGDSIDIFVHASSLIGLLCAHLSPSSLQVSPAPSPASSPLSVGSTLPQVGRPPRSKQPQRVLRIPAPALKLSSYDENGFVIWDSWGVNFTRVLPASVPACVWCYPAYGMKFVGQTCGYVTILDFNPIAVRRNLARRVAGETGISEDEFEDESWSGGKASKVEPDECELFTKVSAYSRPFFAGTVRSALPYCRYKTNIKIAAGQFVMMNEDSVLLVKELKKEFKISSL